MKFDQGMVNTEKISIIGAGPAGLTAAYWLATRHGLKSEIYESSDYVGGISRTVVRDGWRFDIGGHRFFTKVQVVKQVWKEILGDNNFMKRSRMSRIYYNSKFYDYPLKPMNALVNLGFTETLKCIISFLWTQLTMKPSKRRTSFETLVASKFGWRLYRIFFKTYTEKVWGMPAKKIGAEWAEQRIKSLNLARAVIDAIGLKQRKITSLIEEFEYPKFGPGQMWEACLDIVIAKGSKFTPGAKLIGLKRLENGILLQTFSNGLTTISSALFSSMPINELVSVIEEPSVPEEVKYAATQLKHRDFLTVALVVPQIDAFPDNWIYIHSPDVRVGRIQNFDTWSPFMSAEPGCVCLGMEYFVSEGDDLWNQRDEILIEMAKQELVSLGLSKSGQIIKGYVVRVEKAYPVYDHEYKKNLAKLRDWLNLEFPNIFPVGRNGLHTYNNQDHSMLTAILSVENLVNREKHDVWSVNTENEYHEAQSSRASTGRDAPLQNWVN